MIPRTSGDREELADKDEQQAGFLHAADDSERRSNYRHVAESCSACVLEIVV